jgi:HEAT repeat protein
MFLIMGSTESLRKLWSSSESERYQSFEEIRALGRDCIEPLLTLLNDLISDQSPRFSTGNEEEGDRALNDYVACLRNLSASRSLSDFTKGSHRLGTFVINERLRSDAIFLLRTLRAEESIPILIQIAAGSSTWCGHNEPATEALCEFGPLAIPALVELLVEAPELAPKIRTICCSFSLHVVPEHEMVDEQSSNPVQMEDEGDEDDQAALQQMTLKRVASIRKQAAWILGEIGDSRALPVLEGLLRSEAGEARFDISMAIKKIKGAGQPPRPGPRPPIVAPHQRRQWPRKEGDRIVW